MGRRISLFVVLGLLLPLPAVARPAVAQEAVGTARVTVSNNQFEPAAVQLEQTTASVTWTVLEGHHTVTADDGSFGSDLLSPGDSFTAQLGAGTFTYFCQLHGSAGGYPNGMTGVVYVAEKPTEPAPEIRTVPSPAFPTVEAALDELPPRSTVLVKPGTYAITKELQIESPGVELRPSGTGGVTFTRAASGDAVVGLVIAADDVAVRNVTVQGFGARAIVVDGRRAMLDTVSTSGGEHGIRVLRRGSADIHRPRVSGATAAGISVSGCRPLDLATKCAYVSDGSVTGPGAGVVIDSAGSVSVVRMLLDVAATGIHARSSSSAFLAQNRIVRSSVGVRVSEAASRTVVRGNTITATGFGLAWDKTGVDNCFRDNVDAMRAPATSDPQMLEAMPCLDEVRE